MATAEQIIKQAQAWLGCRESNGTHKPIINIYNEHKPLARGYKVKYTDAWCATFVSAVAIKCEATDIIPTECSCNKQIELFKDLGVWVEDESKLPKAGDIIFYDWQDSGKGDNRGSSEHVGIIEAVNVARRKVSVIEGNKNNAVERRTLSLNGRYIRGYARPAYGGAAKPKPAAKPKAEPKKAAKAGLEVDGLWGPATTKALQKALGTTQDGVISEQYASYKGANPGLLASTFEWRAKPAAGGSEVIKALQKKLKISADGYIGPKTIKALQGYLETSIDGRIDKPSECVRALQKALNEGKF